MSTEEDSKHNSLQNKSADQETNSDSLKETTIYDYYGDMEMGGGFRNRMFGSRYGDSEEDPMSGLGNLADVMLVFACGLMLALVAYWNLDLPNIEEVVASEQVREIDDVDELTDFLNSEGSGYTERGRVFEDPETGQLYMLTGGDEEASSDDTSDEASDEASGEGSGDDASGEGTSDEETPDDLMTGEATLDTGTTVN